MRPWLLPLVISLLSCGDDFQPSKQPDQVTQVNQRSPEPADCNLSAGLLWQTVTRDHGKNWPRVVSASVEGAALALAEQLSSVGHTVGVFTLIDFTPLTAEVMIQAAVRGDERLASDVESLRSTIRERLYRAGARTFLLIHNDPSIWFVAGEEPVLNSQRNGAGRLVGINHPAVEGLEAGELGVLTFDDRVCDTDISYSVTIDLSRQSDSTRVSNHFVIGGEGNPVPMLQAVLAGYKPPPSMDGSVSITTKGGVTKSGIRLSAGDIASIGSFALDVVRLLLRI